MTGTCNTCGEAEPFTLGSFFCCAFDTETVAQPGVLCPLWKSRHIAEPGDAPLVSDHADDEKRCSQGK
jgi:hypothetical protein